MSSVNAKVVPFHEALTFTRASTKWVWDGTGKLAEVPVDQPAYDHDPLTGEALGVLIEPGATNLLPWSEDFSQWGLSSSVSVNTNVNLSPTGEMTAAEVVTDGSNLPQASTSASIPADTSTYVGSFYVAKTTDATAFPLLTLSFTGGTNQNNQYAGINTNTGGVTVTNGSLVVETVESRGDYWWVVVSNQNNGTNASVNSSIMPARSDEAGNLVMVAGSVVVWGAQIETGQVATSYIPTAGAAVTRAGDSMSRDLGTEFNGQEGTLLLNYREFNRADSAYLATVFSSGDNELTLFSKSSGSLNLVIENNGVNHVYTPVGYPTQGEYHKAGIAFKVGDVHIASDGISASDSTPSLPAMDKLMLGSRGSNHMTGHIKSCDYYPYAMTAAELEALTAP